MTDPTPLLPCPFCCGEAEFVRKGTAKQSCIVACANCGCSLETGEVWSSGERWNARAVNRSALEALEAFTAAMGKYGEWDDGCFYYAGKSASELQRPIELAKTAISNLTVSP